MTVLPGRQRDPRELAPVGCYMTDETVLVEILEADWSGALGEDLRTGNLVEIERIDLMQRWRRVRPNRGA